MRRWWIGIIGRVGQIGLIGQVGQIGQIRLIGLIRLISPLSVHTGGLDGASSVLPSRRRSGGFFRRFPGFEGLIYREGGA
jgi:hypothetical protein